MSLRSEFRVVMVVAISACKRYSVRLYLQLFVRGLMSYLRYLCWRIVVSNAYCFVFSLCLSSSCVHYICLPVSLDCVVLIGPSVFSNVYKVIRSVVVIRKHQFIGFNA